VPAVIQDVQTGKVLMLGYMNEAAYQKTEAEGIVTFFSRSNSASGPRAKRPVISCM
jgi:phosphoribosyl-ATP pyrophosphohydrolase/phosphoribosyl-AMP cyclohydrolase